MQRHFTATAFVIDDAKRVLLLWHKRLERWMPPGGHIEPDEMPEEAAIRECKEETGLEVRLQSDRQPNLFQDDPSEGRMLVKPFAMLLEEIPASPVYSEPAHQHMDFLFVARPVDGPQILKLSEEEGTELRWFTREDIAALPDDALFANVRRYILLVLA